MNSQEMELLELQEIDLVELGTISEMVQENAPKGPREYTVAPGRWWQPEVIYIDDDE